MLREKELPVFLEALNSLDKKLKGMGKHIVIHAIGGFVMLYYGIKEHGFTIDIDTMTNAYDDSIINAIAEVSKEFDLEKDWLNNDCANLEGFMDELFPKIKWEKSSYEFENIELFIADQIGMIRVKAKAVHDGGLVPRKTDKKDLMLMLKKININSIYELDGDLELDFIKKEYSRTYKFLTDMKEWSKA